MKKHSLNISVVSILCVLCAVSIGDAFAAGSVRALGGTGTYDGTSAAATATTATRGATATRAGSLRVSPSTTRSVSTATRTNANGTTTPTERLSIGKYLGGATSVSTTGSSGSDGSSATAGEIRQIKEDIQTLFNTTQTLDGDVTSLENEKQDKLTANDGIVQIVGDVISINMTNLGDELEGMFVKGTDLEIRYDGTSNLEWQYAGTGDWTKLMNLNDLTGTYVTTEQLNNKIEELALEGLATRVTAAEADIDAIQDALAAKANAADVYAKTETYSKEEIDAAIADGIGDVDLSGYAKTADLATVATSGSYNDLANKPTIPDAQVNADWNAVSGVAQILNKPDLDEYATLDDLDDYATLDDLDGKQNALTTEQLAAVNSGVTSETVAQVAENKSDIAALDTALAGKQDTLTFDTTPTAGSTNPVTSGGIQAAIAQAQLDGQVDLSGYATTADVNTALADKQDTIGDLADIRSGATAGSTAVQPDDLAEVAFSGDYADLENTPTIPTVPTLISEFENDVPYATTEQLAGKQDNLTTAQLAAVNSGVTAEDVAQITQNETAIGLLIEGKAEKDDVYAKTETYSKTEADNLLAGKADADDMTAALATKQDTISDIATIRSGAAAGATAVQPDDLKQSDWNETNSDSLAFIKNKPTIPEGAVVDDELSMTSENAVQNKVVTGALPNFDTEAGGVVAVPSQHGAYVLGYVNGKPAYIAVVDGDGETGTDVPWGD